MKRITFNMILIFLLTLFAGKSMAQSNIHQCTTDCSPHTWSYRLFVSPLITNLTSDQFKAEEQSALGFNLGGDLIYTFYKKDKLSLNASLGLGITNYNNSRIGDYTNKGWTSEYEQTLNGLQTFYLTENLKGINESQHFTYLDIPVKLGVDYAFSKQWAGFATVGIAYGINLGANYSSTATLTRTGFYPDYNALIYDVDVVGSPYYYPTNKAVSGSGKINAQSNLSVEATLGAKYKLNPNMSIYGSVKWMNGLQNVKQSAATTILASSSTTLNTLASRTDIVESRALGLELGIQINLGDCRDKTTLIDFSGNVSDGKKAVPVGTTLVIKNAGKVIQTIQPDKSGKFSLKLPAGKLYTVEASAPDYVSQTQNVDLMKASKPLSKNFVLKSIPQNVTVSGKVTDAFTGAGLKSKIEISSNGKVVKTVETNEKGEYSVELPKAKGYDVVVSSSDFVSKTEKLDASGSAKNIQKDIALDYMIQGVQLETKVLDTKTGQPVKANMLVKSKDKVIQSSQTDDKGKIVSVVPEGKLYEVEVSANGYVPQRQTIDLTKVQRGVKKVILLEPVVKIEKGLVFKFKNVNFNTGTADLTDESLVVLNMVSTILLENPKLQIEISGHTDNDGKASKNLDLSNRRAHAVMTYLVSKGAKPAQMKALGFGQTKPIATNTTPEGKAENRRVEFKVLGM